MGTRTILLTSHYIVHNHSLHLQRLEADWDLSHVPLSGVARYRNIHNIYSYKYTDLALTWSLKKKTEKKYLKIVNIFIKANTVNMKYTNKVTVFNHDIIYQSVPLNRYCAIYLEISLIYRHQIYIKFTQIQIP